MTDPYVCAICGEDDDSASGGFQTCDVCERHFCLAGDCWKKMKIKNFNPRSGTFGEIVCGKCKEAEDLKHAPRDRRQ